MLPTKLKKYTYAFIMAGILMNILISCDQCFYKTTSTGLQYRIEKKGEGPKPKNGELLLIDIVYKTKDRKVVLDYTNSDSPVIVRYSDSDSNLQADGGIYEAISMLKKGDRFIFKLPAKKALGRQFSEAATKHQLEENTLLYTHVYLKDIVNEKQLEQLQKEQFKAMLEKRKEHIAKQLPKDLEIINNYLDKKQIKASSTNSGLKYTIDKPGKGAHPQPGNTVKVHYVGKTLEGQVFDTSIAEVAQQHNMYDARRHYEPLEFRIGEGSMIEGFEEGIKLLKRHAKAHLFLPSVLAYGEAEFLPYIKAHSNLIFEVELVDILTQ
ncbi:FKBP-type peptidyl-prolyl cis-trans isomerase [Candidatus Amoebophilus asiaticus]|nr:FKBP-type peptidyl-prolyl cis-trans isomerase [Candidatus Amoebophilus asiaticus]